MICGDQCLKIFGFGESKELSPPGKPLLLIKKLGFSHENCTFRTFLNFSFFIRKSQFWAQNDNFFMRNRTFSAQNCSDANHHDTILVENDTVFIRISTFLVQNRTFLAKIVLVRLKIVNFGLKCTL